MEYNIYMKDVHKIYKLRGPWRFIYWKTDPIAKMAILTDPRTSWIIGGWGYYLILQKWVRV